MFSCWGHCPHLKYMHAALYAFLMSSKVLRMHSNCFSMLFAAGSICRNLQWKYYLPAPALLSIQEAVIFVIVEGQ